METNDFEDLRKAIASDKAVRRAVTQQDPTWFMGVFLSDYLKYELAVFHHEMFELMEDPRRLIAIMAFRGSGKSTIMNLCYALWAVLGKQQKKFVLILCRTSGQARSHFLNIKQELEQNTLLRQDLGPFDEDQSAGASSLVLKKLGARIMFAGKDQSIRGTRFGQHRPDLIICDDVEDIQSVQTEEGRESTYRWLKSEVMQAGGDNAKVVVLGNLLDKDSLLMRLKKDIESGKVNGLFRAYPIYDDNGLNLWPGKHKMEEDIDALEMEVGDEVVWKREYLLRYQQPFSLTEIHEYSKLMEEYEARGGRVPLENHERNMGMYKISAPIRVARLKTTTESTY